MRGTPQPPGARRLGARAAAAAAAGGRGARGAQRRGLRSRRGVRRPGSGPFRCPLPPGAAGRARWPVRPGSSGLPRSPPPRTPFPSGLRRFAKCGLALLNFSAAFLALGSAADVLLRGIAAKVTGIDLVPNGPLRNWREEGGRCKIYKCPLFAGRARARGGWWGLGGVAGRHRSAEVELLLMP